MIRSSSPRLLAQANAKARLFADRFKRADVVGIVFLGAIVRGYYDASSDIDIALLTSGDLGVDAPPMFQRLDGFEVHCWVSEYGNEVSQPWSMGKRWTYAESQIYYDPKGLVAPLIAARIRLTDEERRSLLMTGAALSEWYVRRLSALWVERGSLVSAHAMLQEGMSYFYDVLFALNNSLVADHKWRVYYAERLPLLPDRFPERLCEVMTVNDLTASELERRVGAFMRMWEEMIPRVEKEIGIPFEVFKDMV